MRRRLNVRFLVGLIAIVVMAGGGVHLVHGYQEKGNATALLRRADRAEKEGDVAGAEKYLGRYLACRPDDDAAQARYALSLAGHADDGRSAWQALQKLERTLLHLPSRADVRRRAAVLAMTPGIDQFKDAADHLAYLLLEPGLGRPPGPDDRRRLDGLLLGYARGGGGPGQPPPADLAALLAGHDAGLEVLFGRCLQELAMSDRPERAGDRRLQALGCFRVALARSPGEIEAYERMAELLRGPLGDVARADRVMDASEVVDGLIARNPESARAYLARARYRDSRQIAGAVEDVSRAMQLAPEDAEVILAAATSAQGGGNLDAARELVVRGEQLHPGDTRMNQARALIEARSGNTEGAIAALRRGLDGKPDDPTLRLNVAELLAQAGRVREAREELARLRAGGDIAPAPLDHLEAGLRIREGRWPEAIQLLEKVRAQCASDPRAAGLARAADLLLAQGYERTGNPERGLAASLRVLEGDPGSLPARAAQAASLFGMGRLDEALAIYREIAPHSPGARLAVAELLLARNARLPEERRDWPQVDAALDEAARAMPGSAEVEVLRARSLVARGRPEQARELIRRARDAEPQRVEYWVALAGLVGADAPPGAAIAILDEARGKLGDRVELALARADYWGRRGGEEARRALEQLGRDLDRYPDEDRLRVKDQLALSRLRMGDREEAGRLWGEVAVARPRDLRVATMLFDLAEATGDEARIRRAIDHIKEIEGADGPIWRYAEAITLIARAGQGGAGDLAAARLLVGELAARRPGWSRTSLLEAKIAELEKDTNRAITAYLRAIDDGEKQPEVILRAAQLLDSRGRGAEIDRLVRRLLDQGETFGVVARLGAERALRRKESDLAAELAQKAVSPDSTDYRDHLWLGLIFENSDRSGEAEAEYRRAVAMAEIRPETWLSLISFLAKADRKDAAQAEIERARSKLPPDQVPLTLASAYQRIGDIARAEAEYHSAMAARPDDLAVLMAAARFALIRGRAPDAEVLLRRVLGPGFKASGPEVIHANRLLAASLIVRGGPSRLREAMQVVDRNLREGGGVEDRRLRMNVLAAQRYRSKELLLALEELSKDRAAMPADRILLGQYYLKYRDWAKAREVFLSGLSSDKGNPQILGGLAECSLGQGSLDEGKIWLEELEKVAPSLLRTQELKARLLEKQGRGGDAVTLLRARARGDEARSVVALLDELGHPAEAEAVLREATSGAPGSEADLRLASFLGTHGRAQEALDLCEGAWKACPAEAVSSTCIEILYAAQAGDEPCNRVDRWLEEALRKKPGSIALRFDLANLRTIQLRFRDAEAILREILARDGDHVGALNNLAFAVALAKDGRADEALALVDQAIAAAGPSPALLETRAAAHLAMGRGDSAIRDLESALGEAEAQKSEVACGYFLMAQARMMGNDRVAAAADLRKAMDAGLSIAMIHPLERETFARLQSELGRGATSAPPSSKVVTRP